MRFFRKLLKIALTIAWLPVWGVWSFFCHLGGRRGIKRVSYCTRVWGRGLVGILRLNISLEGADARAAEGGLIVSNHQSYLDILVHASLFPIRFTPKKEIRSWWLLGPYLGISRPIWIDRSCPQQSARALTEFRATLSEDIPLLVYPEGTTTDGEGALLPFKSTPFEAVVGTDFPIRPVLTLYERPRDGWNPAWYGDQTLMPHLWQFLSYPAIRVRVIALPICHAMPGEDRKALARRIHAIMQEAWTKERCAAQ